ncbi:MAG: LytTR family transcriptional regulator DNA-binding domain-containing protein [Muribaculaceae bacterium]|nr:LytTR family transcriptional regulator DNA-binding domain-containing protein [Muribaculaceae bacterium]
MSGEKKQTVTIRVISVCFTVLVLAIFKPFGLEAWQWQAYAHLLAIGALGVVICFVTEAILRYVLRKPGSLDRGVDYIIRRNLWFQLINTPLITLMICLYRHFVLSDIVEANRLSWGNFFETLVIIAFCSFLIGLYWRFKFRSRYLAAELEETKQMNEQLQRLQQETRPQEVVAAVPYQEEQPSPTVESQPSSTIDLTGSTSDVVTVYVPNLLYIESVGNYVKVIQLHEGKVISDMLRATSKQVEERLQDYPMIVRCHRAFLVNLHQVEQIVSKAGAMQLLIKHSNDAIPVSRSNMAGVKAAIAQR